MSDLFASWWSEITSRPEGPLALRFYVQPTLALVLAVHDGLRDARQGKPAWLWSVFRNAEHRRDLLANGWKSIGKVFAVAVALDIVYQLIVLRSLRPLQAVLIAVAVALVPYALARGPANRLSRRGRARRREAAA